MVYTLSTIKIYPVLPTEAVQDVNAFRLQKINDMQKEISVERNEREKPYTKYNKIDTTLSIVETMSEGCAVAAGSIGIASIANVVAALVGFVLEGMAIGLGAAAIAMKYAGRKITKKNRNTTRV